MFDPKFPLTEDNFPDDLDQLTEPYADPNRIDTRDLFKAMGSLTLLCASLIGWTAGWIPLWASGVLGGVAVWMMYRVANADTAFATLPPGVPTRDWEAEK